MSSVLYDTYINLREERKDIFGLFEDGKFSEDSFNPKKFYEYLETI